MTSRQKKRPEPRFDWFIPIDGDGEHIGTRVPSHIRRSSTFARSSRRLRTIAEELLGYWRLGIDEFILSGFPHVEECRRFAADGLPLLRARIQTERTEGLS